MSSRTIGPSTVVGAEPVKAATADASEPGGVSRWWTFLGGAGSVLEIFPPPERIHQERSDADAVAEAWQSVAYDLWAAIDAFEANTPALDKAKERPSRSIEMARAQRPPTNPDWPSAELLEAYERAVPGSAKAIIDDALKGSEHRREMDRRRSEMDRPSLLARISIARWGHFLGFAIGIAALIAGAFTATQGYEIAGSFIGTGGVVSLVSVFVLGRMKLGETTVEK